MAALGDEDVGLLEEAADVPRPPRGSRAGAALAVLSGLLLSAAVAVVAQHGRTAAAASVGSLIGEAKKGSASSTIERVVPVPQTAYVLEYEVSSKDKVSFTAVRSMGALITSFRLNDVELILETPSVESGMQGSTFWPSPQSLWSWPPPPSISGGWEWDGDNGRAAEGGGIYDAQVDDEKSELLFTSQPDPKLGIRVKKSFVVDSERKAMVLRYTMEMTDSSKTVKVAPWEKTNVPKGAFIFWQHGESEGIDRYDNMSKPVKSAVEVKGDLFTFDHNKEKINDGGTKIATNTTSNWIASVREKTLFVKVFQSVPEGGAAPGEGDLAVFARPGFASLENQGAYKEVSEEKPLVYVVCWYARPLPPGAEGAKGNKKLMDAVDEVVKLGCPKE